MPSQRAKYEPIARAAAAKYGLDADTYVRQISAESNFDPDAVSPAGAIGIAQIIPRWHPKVAPRDPVASLEYAAKWMSELVARFGSIRTALIAYNAGPGFANRWSGQDADLPAETRGYLRKILDAGGVPVAETWAFPIVGWRGTVQLHHAKHNGASDLFANPGTPVVAMCGGTVEEAGWDNTGGNFVLYTGAPYAKGLTFYYAHLIAAPKVRAGQRVVAGTSFGGVGETGNARGTGAHLHIGIGTRILTGVGPAGGAGESWEPVTGNAVALLKRVQKMPAPGPPPSPPPPAPPPPDELTALRARVAELETVLGYLSGDVARAIRDDVSVAQENLGAALAAVATLERRGQ